MSCKRATVFHIDSFERSSTGALRVKGALTKTGVFDYQFGDATVRELRADAEVFSPESLDTLRGAPVTIDHPARFVDTENWGLISVGNVLSVSVEAPYVLGELQIHDPRAIAAIENDSLKEISLGYATDVVEHGDSAASADFAQTNIKYNHVALGPEGWGRLGRDCALRLDADRNLIFEDFMPNTVETRTDAVATATTEEATAPAASEEETEETTEENTDSAETTEEPQLTLDSLNSKLDEILTRLPAVEQTDADEEAPATEERADSLAVDELVAEKVAQTLTARDAFSRVFPSERVDGLSCRELADRVVKHADSEASTEGDTEAQLVEKADLVAKATKDNASDGGSRLRDLIIGKDAPSAPAGTLSFADRIRAVK